MVKISWCKLQNKGIKLIEPNNNLCKEYIQTAEETLEVLKTIQGKSKIWLATTKYYCEYFAIYSVLMKIGIKSEIHDCTIVISAILEHENIIANNYTKILEDDKQLRIDNQYYLKNKEVPVNYDKIVEFVLTLKNIGNKLTSDDVEKIRKIISEE